jgi:hypothetical protein
MSNDRLRWDSRSRHRRGACGRCRRRSQSSRLGLGRRLGRFCRGFLRGEILEMLPHQLGVLEIKRARVRLLFLDADLRQVVDQHFGLDLEFPCQFIDANLIGFCH